MALKKKIKTSTITVRTNEKTIRWYKKQAKDADKTQTEYLRMCLDHYKELNLNPIS